ncbi:beta-N-acetylhexosaminidase [Acidobacterium sp. S8]|uniref:beta-N-acetylhexosaminidase n=1 Tax=Acidobacterium sp. S8 TaxID=1641854 RepID=UPI00131AE75B|nr:beta-N-acetylhexosaminidase [Acidobacterium sp. S8]
MSAQTTQPTFTNTLMPEPAKFTAGQGSFALTSSFTVAAPQFRDERLDAGIGRMLHRLEYQTGVPISKAIQKDSAGASLVIEVKGAGEMVQSVDEDESYSLNVAANGVKLQANTVVGALRGMETLLQLVQVSGSGYILPAVSIEDTPRFRWRGLLIDCGRHFEPVSVIERTLDGMAAVKLNVLHWHLTEDQGFRIESKIYPKLTGMGSDGLYYTQDQAKEVVAYARARGIRVVPEFDMPGHSVSWFVGYPEISSGSGPYQVRREFGISDEAMDPTRDSVYKFLDNFIGEMTTIFPDPYLHIGGDETKGVQWKQNPKIVEFMQKHDLKDPAALQAYFNQHLLKILEKHHRHMIGWDEVLNPALPKDVMIQSWRGEESLGASAKQGYQGILSAPYYLDAMKSAEEHYLADPLPSTSDLTPEQRTLILGGEVCMWGEQINEGTIDSRIWPRTAVIAERFWSPENVRDVDDMYRRLAVVSVRLEAFGLTHITHEDVGLRALTGTKDIDALRVFASVLQPVSFGNRYQGQHTSQLTPLNHLVDAVRPDPPSRHDLEVLVNAFLQNPSQHEAERHQLENIFSSWTAAAPKVQQQVAASPLLAEDATTGRAQQFAQLAQIGSEAVARLAGGNGSQADWKQNSLAVLDAAQKPQGLVRFTVLDPLRKLVEAGQ